MTRSVRLTLAGRLPAGPSPSTVAQAFVKEINKQVIEDKPIWEHKTFLPVPALADTDGPILKFRKWYSQFYAEGLPAGA